MKVLHWASRSRFRCSFARLHDSASGVQRDPALAVITLVKGGAGGAGVAEAGAGEVTGAGAGVGTGAGVDAGVAVCDRGVLRGSVWLLRAPLNNIPSPAAIKADGNGDVCPGEGLGNPLPDDGELAGCGVPVGVVEVDGDGNEGGVGFGGNGTVSWLGGGGFGISTRGGMGTGTGCGGVGGSGRGGGGNGCGAVTITRPRGRRMTGALPIVTGGFGGRRPTITISPSSYGPNGPRLRSAPPRPARRTAVPRFMRSACVR